MFVLTLILFITLAMRGSVVFYYFRYYMHAENYASLFGMFNVLGTSSTIIGIFFSKGLATKFGKRNVFIGGLAGTTLFTALFVFSPPDSGDVDLRDGDGPAIRLRLYHSAALGDDGGRRRLFGMEEQAPRNRDCLFSDRFCIEGGPRVRRRDHRICAFVVWLCA